MSILVKALLALSLVIGPVDAVARTETEMHAASAALRPGQYVWNDEAEDAAPSIVISLALQRAYVYRGSALLGVASVSTGRRGRSTPLGSFVTLEKARWHRSNLYSNAPMPFMQRLTLDGIALHAGINPGYPASHGCIRLPTAFARELFELVPVGSPVIVADYPLQFPIRLAVEDDGVGFGPALPRLGYSVDVFG